jgi:hypothetical protein
MAMTDRKTRFFLIAAVCGALGVASGYALFLISDEILGKPLHFFVALLGAAFVSYIIEWLRDLIRHGEIEVESHPIIRSIGTFVVVLLFELFIAGFEAGLKLGSGALRNAANSLLGDDAASIEGIPWTVVLVAGMWIVAGALLAGWLSLQIGRDEDKTTARHVLRSSRWGTIGGLVIAPAIIGLYILGGRTLVTLQYFVTTTPTTTARYVDLATLLQVSHNNGFFVVLDLPVELLRVAANRSLPLFWFCYLGLFLVIAVLLALQKRWTDRGFLTTLIFFLLLGLLFGALNPIVRSIWAVLTQLMHHDSLFNLLDAVFLGAVVWAIPGLLLGGLVPLLKRAGRNPQSWAFIGYGAVALLILACLLTQHVWPLIPAVIALFSGLLFHRGMPVKEFWPFAALCVAIGISGAMSVSQKLTFSGVLLNLHHIDELQLPLPGAQPTVLPHAAPTLLDDPRSIGLTDDQIGLLQKHGLDDREKAEEAEKNARILEIAIAGSVGFWTTVGLLACWSMYEHEHPFAPK